MKIIPLFCLLFILLAFTASAQWFMPLDCKSLNNNQVKPKTEFSSPADICFYGSGFSDGSVTVILDNSHTVKATITNGILTSLNGFVFVDIPTGSYTMKVQTSSEVIEYPLTIKVSKDSGHAEVPEFSLVGMFAIFMIAGLFIAVRRRN